MFSVTLIFSVGWSESLTFSDCVVYYILYIYLYSVFSFFIDLRPKIHLFLCFSKYLIVPEKQRQELICEACKASRNLIQSLHALQNTAWS